MQFKQYIMNKNDKFKYLFLVPVFALTVTWGTKATSPLPSAKQRKAPL